MLALLALALLLPLAAQSTASVYVHVETSPFGNVTFNVTPSLDDEADDAAVLDAVPPALNCQWTTLKKTDASLNGVCRGWLTTGESESTDKLRLAPLVATLHRQGADTVHIALDVRGNQSASAPEGWDSSEQTRLLPSVFSFTSRRASELPPDFPIPVQPPQPVAGLMTPILIVLFVPGLLSYAIRVRATGASAGQKVNWIVWMNWINLAAWLYWISAINVTDLGEAMMLAGFISYFASLGLGVAIYAFPPLIAVAACLAAMAPLLSSSPESFSLLLKRRIVAEASIIVPLGIFLVGSGLSYNWGYYGTFSLVGAYLVYRALAWTHWSMTYTEVRPVESGELFDRASALAQRAGVTISRLGILQTRVREEANAFASSGGAVTLTESLLRGLTPREVDAVIAHELGHHKSGHLRFNLPQLLFWVYIVGIGPAFGWLTANFHLPTWLITLPLTPILFIALQGLLSQKREFAADARAAEITGDPEGKIAALARLSQLSRIPVQDGGIMGSIMSHPSMQKRVLALARTHNIPDSRALAILQNPNEAYTVGFAGPTWDTNLPPEAPAFQPVFTLRAKTVLLEQLRWWHLLGPLAAACLIAATPSLPFFLRSRETVLWTLAVGPFAILCVTLIVEVLWQVRFERRMRVTIGSRLSLALPATFVGIHPGHGVRFTEGFAEWDFGFVSLEGDWLCYRGEKTRFAISRQEIRDIAIVKDRPTWLREHRVEVVFSSGAFTVNTNFVRPTMSNARNTAKWIQDWASATTSAEPSGSRPEPPPLLPNLPGLESSRVSAFWYACKTILKLWLVGPLAAMAGFNTGFTMVLIMLVAPAAAFLRMLPAIIWPIRRPRPSADATQANPIGEPARP